MISLQQIIHAVNSSIQLSDEIQGINKALAITDVNFNENSIGWCSDKNSHLIENINAGKVIVSKDIYAEKSVKSSDLVLIPVENPRQAFQKILQAFFYDKPIFGEISQNAVIHESVLYNSLKVSIGPNVVIEKGCELGSNLIIGANTVIKSDTIIHDNCAIGSNCTIGGVGFGYELNENNEYELMPHIGNVLILSNVEIGNNVCIDKAVMGSTIIGEHVKIDNLVHIAHGVEIGKNSLIIANAMIAGSVKIGENVWVAPSASVRQKLEIGNDSMIGLGSVVVKNVNSNTIVAGNPAKEFPKK
jgi:UDP-3-O-[3-hydroxymyristoyl] glucosamine N-acyltransferase